MKIETDINAFVAKFKEPNVTTVPFDFILSTVLPSIVVGKPSFIYGATPEDVANLLQYAPEKRVLILSQTFRGAKLFFKAVESLLPAVEKVEHYLESYNLVVNNSTLHALPNMGTSMLGRRFNAIVVSDSCFVQ